MLKNLVIVESPAKAKTIEKFLGKDYTVMSSYGHIRDLCKKNFSIDINDGFRPVYEIPDDKKSLVADLRKAASQAQTVWLASDEDREGEAIAWHLAEVLDLDPASTRRIVFHEITKNAILHAIENPRTIDMNRVDAQQARRVLDRIVGFELSPVLWKKVKPALSAGRVQSVAVRLIAEREEEIKNFVAEAYMRVTGEFSVDNAVFRAELSRRLPDVATARTFLDDCAKASFAISDVQKRPQHRAPAPPFTTSTLQQEAARKLGFTVAQTMRVAQRLYEAGYITYMRTDSLNLSSMAVSAISKEIVDNIGAPYLKVRQYHTHSKGAQEAHEAIRPTYADRVTVDGTAQEKRLYTLIRQRTLASQMADAEIEKTTVEISISNRSEHFTATGEVVKFDGFMRVYAESRDDADAEASQDDQATLPALAVGSSAQMQAVEAVERYSQPPYRYTEASLVKKLEELGIGRPSTYAPTISTIQQREYVEKGSKPGIERPIAVLKLDNKGRIAETDRTEVVGAEKGKLIPTDIGIVVNRFLTRYFPDILDYNFTASVEEKFDSIADGDMPWNSEMAQFYAKFHPEVEKAMNLRMEHKVGERLLGEEPGTGKPVSVKIGRFGPLVQIGVNEGEEKPRFASLQKGQSMETITLEEALKLFDFPRNLGTWQDNDITVAIGRFGPYVKFGKMFVSIPKDINPAEVTMEQAVALIEEKQREQDNRTVKVFDADPDMQVLNGRYGVYIAYKGSNYKIPKTVAEPEALTLDECMAIVADQKNKPKTTRRATARKR